MDGNLSKGLLSHGGKALEFCPFCCSLPLADEDFCALFRIPSFLTNALAILCLYIFNSFICISTAVIFFKKKLI